MTPPSATSAAPILTLTGNLLAERTLEFDTWKVGSTQRALRESFQVGGKGINVARMLHRLKSPVVSWAFVGGETGAESERWLRSRGLRYQLFPTAGATRSGFVIRAPGTPETTFFTPDGAPDAAALRQCARQVDGLPDGTWLALCGSFPGFLLPEATSLRAALERFARRAHLVVDAHGAPLSWAVGVSAELIKINATELREQDDTVGSTSPGSGDVFRHKPTREDRTARLLESLAASHPPRAWIVTDGPGPVWIASRGKIEQSIVPPVVQEVSATGSGDVFLACALHVRVFRGASWVEAASFALPFAAANAAHAGIAEFPLP